MNRQPLFVLAILASAFLIFLVQPMVGKRILPWFGGTASVWTVCLAFYQTTLFLGYAYAHLLIRFASPVAQLGIHALVVFAAFITLPVLPDEAWQTVDVTHPSLDILTMLASSVALPFMALASTGPLVQAWFARSYPDRSPYPLYAVSNLGSFAALLAYPFILEPRLPLSTTGTLWSVAFTATALSVLACAFVARHARRDPELTAAPTPTDGTGPSTMIHAALWVLLAGCAVILLMGVTNSVCIDVASVPFLWILPLATYLMTFILCFASEANYRPIPYLLLTVSAFFLTVGSHFTVDLILPLVDDVVRTSIERIIGSLYMQIPAYCALLFGSCMILHGELYRLRPPSNRLTAFYLCVSGGGALGGLFVGLLAPFLFDHYYETRVGLALALLLPVAAHALKTNRTGHSRRHPWPWRVATGLGVVLGMYALIPHGDTQKATLYRHRGFFGVLQVTESGEGRARQRHLLSGSTLHGLQFMAEKDQLIPSSYYGRATSIAAALAQRSQDRPSTIGLIGLGVGTLSAYGREGDSFRYYEIDPAVAHVARDSGYFTFLEKSLAHVEIVLGDARLVIAKELKQTGSQAFDFLILDAFNSDAIPVHLLTVEAFRLYSKALASDGVLAVHASNRHFNLLPLVARVGLEVGLEPLIVRTGAVPEYQSQATEWIMLSRDPKQLGKITDSLRMRTQDMELPPNYALAERQSIAELRAVPLWTDDYSDLLSVLRAKE